MYRIRSRHCNWRSSDVDVNVNVDSDINIDRFLAIALSDLSIFLSVRSVDIRAGERSVYAFKELGKMGALGHRCAVAEMFGLKFSGFFAWWLWRTIYLMKLPRWGRRLKVASSWTLDLFLPTELVQLDVARPGRSHPPDVARAA